MATNGRGAAESKRGKKAAAIAAGVLVVGVGVSWTLASWNDSEWVSALTNGGGPGLGTSSFNVQQNTSSAFDNAAINWADRETNPGGALTFSLNALSLTPGDTTYAPVALRTDDPSVEGTVSLQGAVPAVARNQNDPTPQNDTDLFAALKVSVYTAAGSGTSLAAPSDCNASVATSADWSVVLNNVDLGVGASGAAAKQTLLENSSSVQHYCFAITLPANASGVDALQGQAVSPAWRFAGESTGL